MRRQKKSFLPDKSRKLIGDRLLDVIFAMICFGIGWLITGGVLGLEAGESRPLQYWVAGCCATMPILWRIAGRSSSWANRAAVAAVWFFACFFLCFLNR